MSTGQTAKKDITLEDAIDRMKAHGEKFINHHAPHLHDIKVRLVPSCDLSVMYANVGNLREP